MTFDARKLSLLELLSMMAEEIGPDMAPQLREEYRQCCLSIRSTNSHTLLAIAEPRSSLVPGLAHRSPPPTV